MTKNEKAPLDFLSRSYSGLDSISRELKYRVLYLGLVLLALTGFIYINLGLYIEFQWSYYFNYYQFSDFDWREGIRELSRWEVDFINKDALHLEQKGLEVGVEIEEFKNFFVSIISCFSTQSSPALNQGLVGTASRQSGIVGSQLTYAIYLAFLTYQLILLSVYHSFCFFCPAVLQQSRVTLFSCLQGLILALLLHFMCLPYVLSIYEEFLIEGVDTELFYIPSRDLLTAWVACFYSLLTVMGLAFISFAFFVF